MGRKDNTKKKTFAVAPITDNVRDHDNDVQRMPSTDI
jgi:hypothetical protein